MPHQLPKAVVAVRPGGGARAQTLPPAIANCGQRQLCRNAKACRAGVWGAGASRRRVSPCPQWPLDALCGGWRVGAARGGLWSRTWCVELLCVTACGFPIVDFRETIDKEP